ncbi:guanine nucleotide exchange factor subunit Rich [Anabrus simplex]|uniref:guanine nucleotide exchange factor subunit Rich n=1 Tax=Anabrus simplex TaxID=316456 RepID=UPI0035A3B635
MYFPIGWPRELNIPQAYSCDIRQVVCNRDKILFAILTDDSLSIWFCKPCVPIVSHQRTSESVKSLGMNALVEWRPDSSMLLVATLEGYLLLYKLGVTADQKGLYEQIDSPHPNLRRDSAELFIKEVIPPLHLTLDKEVAVDGGITSMVCIRDELMLATTNGHILRYRWDGLQNRDYCLDLRRVPFCVDQQVSKAIPILESNTYVVDIEYSPLVGGFAVVLNDGRAAFLTAASLRFDPNQVQGIWAQNLDDATCASVNHKYRLIVFGRKNSQGIVYYVDESTGGLEVSHHIVLSSKDYPGSPGHVQCIRWTPDGCAMAVAWSHGGLSLWSTFGALLMCTLGWDYGLHVDLVHSNPILIHSMEWSAEGYQLWMVNRQLDHDPGGSVDSELKHTVIQLDFVKSALTVNPCMSHHCYLYLQGEDRLFVNLGERVKSYSEHSREQHSSLYNQGSAFPDRSTTLMGSKQWIVVQIPSAYSGTNWPIRYTAIDSEGQNIAVAGRTGLAHYSMVTRKWKLFGNETQEKDFVVTGGLLWWHDHVVMGCYSIVDNRDEIRVYPRDSRLDNTFLKSTRVSAQVLLLNTLRDRLITFCATGQVSIYSLVMKDNQSFGSVEVLKLQSVDISALCVHPACVVSVTLTSLRTETGRHVPKEVESIMLNISGRLMMVQREHSYKNEMSDESLFQCAPPTVLASCVENVWVPRKSRREKPHLTEALWLFCGAHGMRVWLPLFPRDGDKAHTFMSKRIMLPFQLRIYPLAILFEDAILLGAENDTMLYTSDSSSLFSLPFCFLEKTSQVYLHQILRQLIRRNLGYHAWEIARSCTSLPYFPHSLELLLHEVLEEEATSKEPIPDALMPSVIEFIQEFPVYLQTVVQCARKTEIALWPYLFSAAGKPKDLFQECLEKKQLDTAGSYLIILQNLEPSSVSRQYATLLLDAALEHCKWDLSKDLVRFLRAIDPNDVESPRASFILPSKYGVNTQTPPVSPNEEDLSLVLGTMQVSRGRSFSTTTTPKVQQIEMGTTTVSGHHREVLRSLSGTSEATKSVPLRRKKSVPTGRVDAREPSGSAEEFFIDVILQRHARRLLSSRRLSDLGHFAAHLDFHLVTWLARERDRVARVDDFVDALKKLHQDFAWPYPVLQHPVSYYLQRKTSAAGSTPASPTIEDRMKSLSVDVLGSSNHSKVEDSGYRSCTGGLHEGYLHTPALGNEHSPHYASSVLLHSEYPSSSIVEAQLMPHLLQDESSMLSEESSFWGDDRDQTFVSESSDSRWSDLPSAMVLEQLSQELSNKGSPKAEVQLRYLLQIFMEASCLEWALIISVLLRDVMAVLRATNAARSPDQVLESVLRLKEGLVQLIQWSNSECLGYKPFMVAIQNQLGVLNKLLSTKQLQHLQQKQLQQQQQQQQQVVTTLPPPSSPRSSRSRRTSSNQDTTSLAATTSGSAERESGVLSESLEEKSSRIDTKMSNSTERTEEVRSNNEIMEENALEIAKEQAMESSGCVIS